jgi:hypothetical protein
MFELAEAADELEVEGEKGQAKVLAMHSDVHADIVAVGTEIQGDALHLHSTSPIHSKCCYGCVKRLVLSDSSRGNVH